MKSLFIFRRDFRLDDNTGLIKCINESSEVLLLFIFTPEQIEKNEYFSSNSFQFLIESLECLNEEIKKYNGHIHYYFGDNISILEKIKKVYDYDKIYINKDYTPYALNREEEINTYLKKEKKELILIEDYLLAPMGTFLKKDNTPYQKYTPFWKNSWDFSIINVNFESPWTNKKKIFITKNDYTISLKFLEK